MFTKSHRKTIFLDRQSDSIDTIDTKVDVILSPSLYWVKKISLPVKYLRDVKKLLPTIFEDILLDGDFSYYAYKSEDAYIVFAYEDRAIVKLLEEKGITSSHLGEVYFAQTELLDAQLPASISDTHVLMLKDSLLITIPSKWVESSSSLDLDHFKHSKHKVPLSQFNHLVDKKVFYRLSGILLAFIFLVGAEIFMTHRHANEIVEKKEALFAKYDLKPTMMQNEAMLKKYEKIHAKQTKLRQAIAKMLALKLQNGDTLSFIEMKENKLYIEISGSKLDYVEKFLKKDAFVFSAKHESNKLRIEIEL